MKLQSKLNIIVPCYNPIKNWEIDFSYKAIELENLITDAQLTFILVNDGSTLNFDTTVAQSLRKSIQNVEIIHLENNKGKGAAIKNGIQHYTADYYIYYDIDFPFGLNCISEIYKQLQLGNDIIVTNRGDEYLKLLPFKRRLLSKFIRILNKYYFSFKYYDTQSGLKGFNNNGKKVFEFIKSNSFVFDIEIMLFAKKMKLKISEIHVSCNPSIHFSNFKKSVIFNELIQLFKILINR